MVSLMEIQIDKFFTDITGNPFGRILGKIRLDSKYAVAVLRNV